jgi:hypothetical protein
VPAFIEIILIIYNCFIDQFQPDDKEDEGGMELYVKVTVVVVPLPIVGVALFLFIWRCKVKPKTQTHGRYQHAKCLLKTAGIQILHEKKTTY